MCHVCFIQQAKMPLDSFNIEVLIQKLDVDKTGLIDYRWVSFLMTDNSHTVYKSARCAIVN